MSATEHATRATSHAKPLQRICSHCGSRLEGKRSDAEFCTDGCRMRHWEAIHPRQGVLKFEPPAAPIQPLRVGPTTAQIQASQKRQTVKVLTMLQEAGPRGVTTAAFLDAYIGRFSARIGELRSVGLTITGKRESEHSWRFVLEGGTVDLRERTS